MSNLAIVDVLLCTRPGRSLLNKLPIYISCAMNSLELTAHYKLNCIAILVSYLNHHKNTWYIVHKFQSTTTTTISQMSLYDIPLRRLTAWISPTDHLHRVLGIDYTWHVETQSCTVQQYGSHLNINCRTNMPLTRQ